MAKKFYVSGVITSLRLDLGREVEAENAFMAGIYFHNAMKNVFTADRMVTVKEVEEVKK